MKQFTMKIFSNFNHFLVITIVILSFSCIDSYASKPYISNFTRLDYRAASQNWAVCFDERGYTYVGNDSGLLEYDGKHWVLHNTVKDMVVQSLYYDHDTRRIYSGGYCDFGYWSRNQYGHLIYQSIVPAEIRLKMKQELIWDISKTPEAMYFQSYQNIYIRDNNTGKWTTIVNIKSLTHNRIDEAIYVEAKDRGIMKIEGSNAQIIPNTEKINNISFFLPWEHESILIGTQHQGFFRLKEGKLKPWHTSATVQLSHKNINRGMIVSDSTFMIGTLEDGIYLISKQGNILTHINKRTGLVNNTILNMGINADKSIYLATDNGISIIHFDAEMNYFIDMKNNPGLITQVFETENYLYIGTNNGIYYTPNEQGLTTFEFENLKRIPAVNGHIWYIKRFDNKLFCGANNGLFEIKGTQVRLVCNDGGGSTSLVKLPNANGFLSTNYYRMSIISTQQDRTSDEKLHFEGLVEGINNTCTDALFDAQNHLWVIGEHEGLFQAYLDIENRQLNAIKKFNKSDGLSNSYNLHMAYIDGHLVVCNADGFFIYDSLNDKLIPNEKMNNLFKEGQRCTNITVQDNHHFWLCTANSAMLVANKNGHYEMEKTYLFEDKYIFPDKFQNISILKDKIIFCLEKGIGVIKRDTAYSYKKYPLNMNKAITINHNISRELPIVSIPEEPIKLSASSNNIQLFYRSANYTPNLIRYRWRILSDKTTEIVPWNHTFEEHLSIGKLKAGKYTIEIKAIFDDHNESNVERYYIEVSDPFIRTNLGKLTLLVIIILTIYSTYLIYKLLLRKNERKLRLKHAQEIREKKTAIKELQNDLMKKQVEKMHSELTLTNNALVQKDEALQAVKDSLDEVYAHLNGRFPKHDYNKIIQVLNRQKSQEQDRKEFERHFQQSQEGFYEQLRKKYPELTNNEMRLCSLLRMNMNTKEIAERLRISPKSAEVSRYRLRKKMKLDSKVNLSRFLQEVTKS